MRKRTLMLVVNCKHRPIGLVLVVGGILFGSAEVLNVHSFILTLCLHIAYHIHILVQCTFDCSSVKETN